MSDFSSGGSEAARSSPEYGGNELCAYQLSADEVNAVTSLIVRLETAFPDPTDSSLYDHAWSFLGEIPPELHDFLARFRLSEFTSACLVTGFPVDDVALGPTPADVPRHRAFAAGSPQEYLVGLIAACLGEVFSWSTLQAGRLIQDVIPIRGEEDAQSGHGSTATLAWHTEDAFHPYRADYLLLLGLRNRGNVPTTVASIRDATLPPDQRAILSEPRFHIVPDDEHISQLAQSDPDHPALRRMREMRIDPPPVAVLYGAPSAPYLRVDPVFMRATDGNREAGAALEALENELEAVQRQIVLEAGDVLVIDNCLSVHGRNSFQAQHDGTDRWLKKALVTRDLRKSRDQRLTASSRIIT